MSIESREKEKTKKKKNVTETRSLAQNVQIIAIETERRFSVEMSSVHENLNAHEGFRRFRLLLCSPIVQIVATFCTNGQETVSTLRACRDIRHFARDHPSG